METIHSLEEFYQAIENNKSVLTYFSTPACSVCHVLKPKVASMLGELFPQMKAFYIPSDQLPEVAAQNRVFTAPTVLVFFEGRETIRKSRAFGIDELKKDIERPYIILYK